VWKIWRHFGHDKEREQVCNWRDTHALLAKKKMRFSPS
jgi:hypothetical protein